MFETALALLLAHAVADFVLQTQWIVENKRRAPAMLAHMAIVGFTAFIALGSANLLVVLAIVAAHLFIDTIKTFALPKGLGSYLADQGAHVLSIMVIASLFPDTFASGHWAAHTQMLLLPAILLTGWIIIAPAGGFAVGLLMERFPNGVLPEGLNGAGRTIGLLERSIIYLMVLIGEPAGIGFLIAAKSILRFDTVSKDPKASEYVIIGTLASFGWAMTLAFITLRIITSQGLEMTPLSP